MVKTPSSSGAFRDTLTTSAQDGGRKWLYPEIVRGVWFNRRAVVAYGLLFSLLAGPFWEWNGHPLFLFDILNRTFIVFGVGFGPHDMNLLVLGILTFAVFIFAFTQTFGRVWCGWACPQTLFMEWVFRPMERLIEGNSGARRKLDSETGLEKTIKKSLKLGFFWFLSFAIANVFLAYLIGKKALWETITDSPLDHWRGLLALLAFTTAFFFVFSRLREIACVIICPYGRLQSTLQNKDSLMVAYDVVRGEPRGHQKKQLTDAAPLGDCIDCNWCVKVCPTGIDIRNGNQMECIQCTECIDACDQVMDKIGKPRNLIGYFSENQLESRSRFQIPGKSIAYFGIWFVLISLLGWLLFTRDPVEIQFIRTPGSTGTELAAGKLGNLYNLEMSNKQFDPQTVEIRPLEPGVQVEWLGRPNLTLGSQEVSKTSFWLSVQGASNLAISRKVKVQIFTNQKPGPVRELSFFYLPQPRS